LATKYQRLNKILNNCVIPFSCSIGAGTKTAYGGIAILIHRNASIGCYCSIGTKVTIGGTRTGVPVIEDNVFIATGACILGGVKISTGTIVGANAVITRNTEPFGVYVGAPSRKVSTVTSKNIGKYQSYHGIKDMIMMRDFLRLHYDLMHVDTWHLMNFSVLLVMWVRGLGLLGCQPWGSSDVDISADAGFTNSCSQKSQTLPKWQT